MIAILDYGMGNLSSVFNAVDYLGFDAEITSTLDSIGEYTHLIIPGVGSFNQAMSNIRNAGLEKRISQLVTQQSVPTLGICLGMQLLASKGTEHGESAGLSLIPGVIEAFPENSTYPVPHVGWNSLIYQNSSHPVFQGVKEDVDFYFVHSYRFHPERDQDVAATTSYGIQFPSVVAQKNVVGCQFHPEKSQDMGLKILENFLEWDGEC